MTRWMSRYGNAEKKQAALNAKCKKVRAKLLTASYYQKFSGPIKGGRSLKYGFGYMNTPENRTELEGMCKEINMLIKNIHGVQAVITKADGTHGETQLNLNASQVKEETCIYSTGAY